MQRISRSLVITVIFLAMGLFHAQAQLKNGWKNPFEQTTWYKRYTGTIGGKPITVNLNLWNNYIDGTFNFTGKSDEIAIRINTKDTVINQQLTVYGFIPNEEYTDTNSKSILTITADNIKGKWTNANHTLSADIFLKEEYPSGTYPFDLEIFRDSIVVEGNNSAMYASYKIPMPGAKMKKDEGIWFEKALAEVIDRDNTGAANMRAYMKIKDSNEFAGYKKLIEDSLGGHDNFYLTLIAEPWYNNNGFVVVKIDYYVAIPQGHTRESYYCLDMERKKIIHLKDIMNVDTAKLEALLEPDMSAYYKPMHPDFNGPYAAVSNEIYVTDGGITFLFGNNDFFKTPCFFVPYSELKGMLKPEFKRRMKL